MTRTDIVLGAGLLLMVGWLFYAWGSILLMVMPT